jgi:hypothetical protein
MTSSSPLGHIVPYPVLRPRGQSFATEAGIGSDPLRPVVPRRPMRRVRRRVVAIAAATYLTRRGPRVAAVGGASSPPGRLPTARHAIFAEVPAARRSLPGHLKHHRPDRTRRRSHRAGLLRRSHRDGQLNSANARQGVASPRIADRRPRRHDASPEHSDPEPGERDRPRSLPAMRALIGHGGTP